MRKTVALSAILAVFAGGAARASDEGFSTSVRTGYVVPMGDIVSVPGYGFGNTVAGLTPVWLDVAYRFTPNISAGVYGSYALALRNNCRSGDECSGTSARVGIEGFYTLVPDQQYRPYVGLGVGYQWLNIKTGSLDQQFRGFEFANLQFGTDWALSQKVCVGPFLMMGAGRYDSVQQNGVDLPGVQTSTHFWLGIGVRATFNAGMAATR